jgi:hypothetical protein
LDLASLLGDGPEAAGQAQSHGEHPGAGSVPAGLDLASLLGGSPADTAQAAQSYGQQTGAGSIVAGLDLGSLVQAIPGGIGGVGGATQAPAASGASGFGNLLGAVMGGGSSTMSSDPFVAPIVNGLTEKLGLPPQIVQAVVAFVMGKLLSSRLQPAGGAAGVSGTAGAIRRRGTTIEDIRQKTNRRKRVTRKELRSSGLAEELSAHTGLDRAIAEASLQAVLSQLRRQLGAGE